MERRPTIGMKQVADKLDRRRLVRILLSKLERQSFFFFFSEKQNKAKTGWALAHLNVPPSNAVSSGPKITACHFMMSSSVGLALTPGGASFSILLKSRNKRRLDGVDITNRPFKTYGHIIFLIIAETESICHL